MRPLTSLFLSSLFALVAACSSGGSQLPPCAMRDAAVYEVGVALPAGCPPEQGNELGIGKACAMCGNDCSPGLDCSCDPKFGTQLAGIPCVCTKFGLNPDPATVPNPCTAVPANFCGTGATCCPYLNAAYYCSPDICLPGGQCIEFVPADGGV